MTRRCDVCGFETEEAVCPRCATVLLRGQASCPRCGKPSSGPIAFCEDCGSALTARVPADDKLREVTLELLTLTDDADFREMPEEVRRDLLDAVIGLSPEAVVREECRRQIQAWRDRGFEVGALEALLDTDLEAFRERGAQLIRVQIHRTSRDSTPRCPLCDARLPPAAQRCDNCGARLG